MLSAQPFYPEGFFYKEMQNLWLLVRHPLVYEVPGAVQSIVNATTVNRLLQLLSANVDVNYQS